LHYHDLDFWGNDAKAAKDNLDQVNAMTTLLSWIIGDNHPVSNNAKKKFENVMQRIGEEIEMELPEEVKWQRYAENIDKILVFWEASYSNLEKVDLKQGKRKFIEIKYDLVEGFESLADCWKPYKRVNILPAYQEVAEYTSVHMNDKKRKKDIESKGFRNILGG
jgi:hypothetical protein